MDAFEDRTGRDVFFIIFALQSNTSSHPELTKVVHELLTSLESLFEKGQFYGSADRLFAIMESCVSKRPVCLMIS